MNPLTEHASDGSSSSGGTGRFAALGWVARETPETCFQDFADRRSQSGDICHHPAGLMFLFNPRNPRYP